MPLREVTTGDPEALVQGHFCVFSLPASPGLYRIPKTKAKKGLNPMSNATSLMYWNEKVQSSQPRTLKLLFSITGAKAVTDLGRSPTMTTFDTAFTQAQIDAHLGTSSEFSLLAFDSTAVGADVFGGVINMSGQCAEVYSMVARCYSASNTVVTRQCEDVAALTASQLLTEVAKGSSGNIAFRVDFGNTPDMDALTAGTIEIEILWRSK